MQDVDEEGFLVNPDALKTLIALGGLQVGDEVRLDPLGFLNQTAGIGVVTEIPPLHNGALAYWTAPNHGVPAVAQTRKSTGTSTVWHCCAANIVGWRRPLAYTST